MADDAKQSSRSLLVVAGSGRSGTSLCSTLLHRLGYAIPQPEVQANRNNPRGYGEPRWAVDFHQRWLDAVEVSKEDARPRAIVKMERLAARPRPRRELQDWLAGEFELADRVVVKDPRLTWFTGLYRDVAAALEVPFGVVTMLRHPVETTRSRETAYGDSLSDISRMTAWVNMMLSVELATRSMPRAIVRYDDLVEDWRAALTVADAALGAAVVGSADDEQLAAADEVVDPGLRRSVASWEEFDVPADLRRLAQATHDLLDTLAGGPIVAAGEATHAALDDVRAEFADYYRFCEQVARTSAVAVRRDQRRKDTEVIRELERELRQAQRALEKTTPVPKVSASSGGPSLWERVRGRVRRLGSRIRSRA